MREQIALYGIAAIFVLGAVIFGANLSQKQMLKDTGMLGWYYFLQFGSVALMVYAAGVLIIWGFRR